MDRSRSVKTGPYAFSLLSFFRHCRPSGTAISLLASGGLPSGIVNRRLRALLSLRSPFIG